MTGAPTPRWPNNSASPHAVAEADCITIVSGLPRSGTSMLMQMLAAGGFPVLTDGRRAADASNPLGYLEYELVKRLAIDSTWLHQARGEAIKIVAPLLPYLPVTAADGSALHYRVLFMQRDLGEIADSQARMLRNLGREQLNQPLPLLLRAMQQDLDTARAWLDQHAVSGLEIDYRTTMAAPASAAAALAHLIPQLRTGPAAAAVQPVGPASA